MTDRLSFASIRVITDDVVSLVKFDERVTGVSATWANDVFAELNTPAATLAVASSSTMALFGPEVAHAADNQSVIIEFLVADVDADHDRLRAWTDSTSRSSRPRPRRKPDQLLHPCYP